MSVDIKEYSLKLIGSQQLRVSNSRNSETIPIDLSIEFMKGNVARLSEKEAKTQDKI